ncbi:MAG: glycine cleavage system protein [Frankiaceae bacterium]|nr:glycine cleavage system protein [Frankiaceae bacterium]MDQ1674523.1 glycine cleavage system protein [Frankiaceae bacterium]
MYPDDLKYTTQHEWVRLDGQTARIGITSYAQDALGDIVFVQLPDVGDGLESGQAFGEVESTKSVSDVYAPVSGEVKAKNEALDSTPELVNSDPYGEGWLIEISVADPSALDGMLDAEAYQRHIDDH